MEGDLKEKKEKLEEKRKLLEKLEKERDEEKFKLVLHKNNKEIQGLKEASATKEREFKEEIENVTAAFIEQKSSLEAGTDARKERMKAIHASTSNRRRRSSHDRRSKAEAKTMDLIFTCCQSHVPCPLRSEAQALHCTYT
ncbi:hypothetical protein QR680_011496 [Steinernema hermaphroditum]|uniref:Uncharacterized protein n=1 Tax=Steinernema hermaphroditum TaxID=289476 RepID=A0AA39LZ25_9BILA|nr:hypothetical protein QR680_011496 [Steinernema hermaphroditum]